MKKVLSFICVMAVSLSLVACGGGGSTSSGSDSNGSASVPSSTTTADTPFVLKTSPDKYTYYVDKYVGMNAASIGYTSLAGKRMIQIQNCYLEAVFVTADGTYVGGEDEEGLKNYVVVKQSVEPNTEIKVTYKKDEEGNEYDNLTDWQSIEKIDLLVKKVGDVDPQVDLVTTTPTPDKYTQYVRSYVGKNLYSAGYISLGGNLMDAYGQGYVQLNPVAEDGSYIDTTDETVLKQYVITGQNVEPNTEIEYVFRKKDDGTEYDNLVESQSISAITLNVKSISGQPVVSTKDSGSSAS